MTNGFFQHFLAYKSKSLCFEMQNVIVVLVISFDDH